MTSYLSKTSRYCYCDLPYRSRSKEKDTIDPLSDKKKIKEEKEDEKVEDVSSIYSVLANL